MPDPALSETVPPPSGLRRAGIIAAIVAVGVVGWGVLARHNDYDTATQVASASSIPTVRLITVGAPKAGSTLTLPATIEAWVSAKLYARVPGYVAGWYRDIGAAVVAGTPLARLDTPDLDQQIAQARASVESAVARAGLARITAVRWADLLKTNSVSVQETDEKKGDLAVQLAAVDSARADLGRLLALKAFATLRAPFAGVVTARSADIGDLVGPGATAAQPLFAVADTRRLRVYVNVPQSYGAAITRGLTATLSVPEFAGRSFPLTVVGISDAVDPRSGAFQVQLETDNARGELKPGGYAQVHFAVTASSGLVEVPASALLFRQEGTIVGTVGPRGHVHLVPVKIARDLGDRVEVSTGLTRGERIIDNPMDSIADGQLVRVAAGG